MDWSFTTIIGIIYIGWIIVTLVLFSIGTAVGSWQKPSQTRLIIFRSPWIARASVISLSLWIFCSPLLFAAMGMFSLLSYAPTGRLGYALLMFIYFGMAYGLATLLIWATPPQETKIDLDQRICLHTRGRGRRQKTWTIPLDQISAVCISSRNRIYLQAVQQEDWLLRIGLGQFPMNGFTPMRPRTLQFAQEMADTLGLPIREVPAGAIR